MKNTPRLNVEQIIQEREVLQVHYQALLGNQNIDIPQLITFFESVFTLMNKLKDGEYIERDLNIESIKPYIEIKYPVLKDCDVNPIEMLTKKDFDLYESYVSYAKLYDCEWNKITDYLKPLHLHFYSIVLPKFSEYFSDLIKVLPISIQTLRNKDNFLELIEYLDKYYLNKEGQIEQFVECPFPSSNEEELYHFIQKKYKKKKNKVFFTYVYKAIEDFHDEWRKQTYLTKDELNKNPSKFRLKDFRDDYFKWVNKMQFEEFKGSICYLSNYSSDNIKMTLKDIVNEYKQNDKKDF